MQTLDCAKCGTLNFGANLTCKNCRAPLREGVQIATAPNQAISPPDNTRLNMQPPVSHGFNKPSRARVNQNRLAVFCGVFLLAVIILQGLLRSCGNNNPAPPATEYAYETATENAYETNRLETDLADNFGGTTWYPRIKTVSVKKKTVEITTDLESNNDSAGRICGGASSLTYSYTRDHDETILILGNRNQVLIRRVGISQQCR